MITGESIPVEQGTGQPADRGDSQRHGLAGDARRAGGKRNPAGADCAHGQPGPAQPRSHSAPGRPGGGLVRSGGDCDCRSDLHGLEFLRAGTAAGACAGECRGGADHCLSVRPGAGYADCDHGRDRPRRSGGRADQERGSAGTDGESGHAGDRQDRHADRRQAAGGVPGHAAGAGRK